MLICLIFVTAGLTDGQTDRQTDIVTYRVACTRLKRGDEDGVKIMNLEEEIRGGNEKLTLIIRSAVS